MVIDLNLPPTFHPMALKSFCQKIRLTLRIPFVSMASRALHMDVVNLLSTLAWTKRGYEKMDYSPFFGPIFLIRRVYYTLCMTKRLKRHTAFCGAYLQSIVNNFYTFTDTDGSSTHHTYSVAVGLPSNTWTKLLCGVFFKSYVKLLRQDFLTVLLCRIAVCVRMKLKTENMYFAVK